MNNEPHPKCFVSYSSSDRSAAERLANALRERGLDVWIDSLQILPGDSLVQKIFEEGLKDCRVFIVLLSPHSVKSEWVKHELDVALINKLKKITRVIPVIVDDCDVPVALRSILWINLKDGIDLAADRIANAAYRKEPAKQFEEPPEFIQRAVAPRAGLSQEAATVGVSIARQMKTSQFPDPLIEGPQIQEETRLLVELINDAVDELAANGLLKVHKFMGTAPFDFGMVEPTYALAYTFPEEVQGEVQPQSDMRQVAAIVASLRETDGNTIAEKLHFEVNRVNFAINYLRDYGIIETVGYMGTAPFSFGHAVATRNTRQFVAEH